ncbi:hypothetical protein KIW84_057887 [Lathyrus oleraceus]|uniref:LTI65/LTI78 N-terminal domain-containing protein n=1 Tax=Pisum sativum TaxID=3888 RepID=A0A9D5AN92_PEA|nr:hypothetical protein KIW84_057887 [Pisum sativum]
MFLFPCAGGESSPTYSPTSVSSPSSPYFGMKSHDLEEDHSLYQRKSVLTKVKERAKKLVLRNSLSRKRLDEENPTPSWGVNLEDEEEDEDDPEYLGAPIYESELAPEEYKENARQHPRANPVISEKRVLKTVKSGEHDQENALTSIKSTSPTTTITKSPQLATTPTNSPKQNTSMTQKPTSSNVEGSNSTLKGPSSQSASSSKYHVGSITPVAPFTSIMMKTASPSLPSVKTNSTSPKSSYHSPGLLSPRRGSNGSSVIERMKGVVSSLLKNDEQAHLKHVVKSPTIHVNSSQTSYTTHDDGRGAENRRRILQTN